MWQGGLRVDVQPGAMLRGYLSYSLRAVKIYLLCLEAAVMTICVRSRR